MANVKLAPLCMANRTAWFVAIFTVVAGLVTSLYIGDRQAARQEEQAHRQAVLQEQKDEATKLYQAIGARQQFLLSLYNRVKIIKAHLYDHDGPRLDTDIREFDTKYTAGELDLKEPQYLRDELFAMSRSCRNYLWMRERNMDPTIASFVLVPDMNLLETHLERVIFELSRQTGDKK